MTAQAAAFREPGLWVSVWHLLRMRLVIVINGFRRANRRKKIGYIAAGIGLLIFLGFILFLSISLLSVLRSPMLVQYVGDMGAFLETFPTMMVSVSAVGILITGFGVLLQALYLSGDMDFLMSAPIPVRAVFIAKLVQAVLPNFGIMCLFTLPLLYGLGISAGYSFLYYPLVLVVLVMLSLTAASLASLLVMAVARIFPARRVAEELGTLPGVATSGLSDVGPLGSCGGYPAEIEGQTGAGQHRRFEGLVRMSDMDDDYYVFDEKQYLLRGERHKKAYRLGDAVRIRVARVDMQTRKIDFVLPNTD